MPSPRFSESLPFILRWEGGYVDHPNDPGGKTNMGVTQAVYDDWRKKANQPAQSVRTISDAEVQAIYESGYWLPPRCDLLEQALDLVQFDTAVNMGVGRAIRFLQQSLGCTVDGGIGPKTQEAIATCDSGDTIVTFCQAREDYYRRLAQSNPKLAVFLPGWLNRLNALRQEAGLPGYAKTRGIESARPEPTARIPDIGRDPQYDL